MAEFLGTALLIFFGTGCVAALKVAGASFGLWEISIIWGVGVSMAIYLSAGISGAHLNPAVTLGQMFRAPKVSLRTGLVYMVTQFLGALLGALLGTPILTQRTGSTTWSPAPTTKPPPSATWPWTSWARPSAPSSSCSSS